MFHVPLSDCCDWFFPQFIYMAHIQTSDSVLSYYHDQVFIIITLFLPYSNTFECLIMSLGIYCLKLYFATMQNLTWEVFFRCVCMLRVRLRHLISGPYSFILDYVCFRVFWIVNCDVLEKCWRQYENLLTYLPITSAWPNTPSTG